MVDEAFLVDLGVQPYQQVHDLQVDLAAWRHRDAASRDVFILVEHPPVFTLGRNGSSEHLGVSPAFLKERSIDVVTIERGGEITYHGPGQLVLYPIISLRARRLGVAAYVEMLEELMLRVAADFGVQTGRDARNHGIWVGNNKLGSIGIAVRHGVSFHGLALNVAPDLTPFSWIDPCGLKNVGMTSLTREGATCTMTDVKKRVRTHIETLFTCPLAPLSASACRELACGVPCS